MSVSFTPTTASKRIELIDIIRGFAVFGILLSNILIISGYLLTPTTDLQNMNFSSLNNILFTISSYAISGKFYPLFCMLFGAGFYMQFSKYQSQDSQFVKYMIKRLIILLFIGLFHQTFWPGDVVTTYALLGFLLIPLRKLEAKKYLLLAIASFSIYLIIGALQKVLTVPPSNPEEVVKKIAMLQFPGVDPYLLVDKVQNEGFSGLLYFNAQQYKLLWAFSRMKFVFFQLIGLFFLGAYLSASGFFVHKAARYKNLILFFTLGVLGNLLMHKVMYQFRLVDNLFFSLTYISLIAIILKGNIGKRVLHFFAPVGRMALTNYILQSALSITIFYGFGFGLFAKTPLYMVYIIAFSILLFEVLFSVIWLRKFQFGPFEWIWRKLTYKRIS